MSHIGLADLLGVRTKSIQWERPQLFFAALLFSDLSWLLFRPLYEWLVSGELSRFYPTPPINWLSAMLNDLLLVTLAALALRLLPYTVLALIAVAISYGPLSRFVTYIILATDSRFSSLKFWEPQAILLTGLWALLFLGGLALAARWLKPLWLALLAGPVAGTLAHFAIQFAINRFTAEPNQASNLLASLTRFLPFRLLDALLFALALWVGLRLTAGKDLSAERKEARMTKGFYLSAVATSIGASLIMLASVMFSITFGGRSSRSDMDQAFTSILFAGLIGLFGSIVFLVLTYRMWNAIQDGYARTSPGRAVGMLFVPFYNLYWIFQAYRGFAEDFNSFGFRHSINTPLLPTGLFTAYGTLTICGVIPFIGWLFVAANFFVMLAMISKICDAVNSIPEKLPDQEMADLFLKPPLDSSELDP